MLFYVNDIVFAFKIIWEQNAKNIIRRMKKMFDIKNLDSLNFFLEMRIIQKPKTVWLIQNFYINKLVKNYVINTKLKTTTSLFYQQLMSHTKEMNDERIRIYWQKMKSFCYLAIITRLNIIKIVFELTRYVTNLSSNPVKTANHCIKYLHATKYLTIRYSNSEDEKLYN
jgi:hypothetical protein